MISEMTKTEQEKLREKYLEEYNQTVLEYGIEPNVAGPYALLRVNDLEEKSAGGIIMNHDQREQEAMRVGMVIKLGPTALCGYELPEGKITRGPEDYGVDVGDFVEYDQHMGRLCAYGQFRKYRVLNASDLYTNYKEVE